MIRVYSSYGFVLHDGRYWESSGVSVLPMVLSPETADRLREWHDAVVAEYECAACNEGQLCCVELLVQVNSL